MDNEIRHSKLKQKVQYLSSDSSQIFYASKTILYLST